MYIHYRPVISQGCGEKQKKNTFYLPTIMKSRGTVNVFAVFFPYFRMFALEFLPVTLKVSSFFLWKTCHCLWRPLGKRRRRRPGWGEPGSRLPTGAQQALAARQTVRNT